MPVTDTSKASYAWLQKYGLGGSCRQRIFRAAISLQRCTRRQLEDATGLRPNQVAGRVAELIECGSLVKAGYAQCEHSGRFVEVLRPKGGIAKRFMDLTEGARA